MTGLRAGYDVMGDGIRRRTAGGEIPAYAGMTRTASDAHPWGHPRHDRRNAILDHRPYFPWVRWTPVTSSR